MREQQVLAYLKAVCKGRKNIQKSRQIQLALHISGNELRKQVHRLRQKGHPIASSQAVTSTPRLPERSTPPLAS